MLSWIYFSFRTVEFLHIICKICPFIFSEFRVRKTECSRKISIKFNAITDLSGFLTKHDVRKRSRRVINHEWIVYTVKLLIYSQKYTKSVCFPGLFRATFASSATYRSGLPALTQNAAFSLDVFFDKKVEFAIITGG